MRILIDECLPKQLKTWLDGEHYVSTVHDTEWASIKNGKLLALANDAGFELFVTADKNMYFQQNFANKKISAVVIPSNRKLLVQNAVPPFLQSLAHVRPGQKIVMDLGSDADAWLRLRLHAIEQQEHHTAHIFKPNEVGL